MPERAEGPPYHGTRHTDGQVDLRPQDHQRQAVPSATHDATGFQVESDHGRSCEPIQLLDREETPAVHLTPGPHHPRPIAQASGPRVFRRDAMVGVTDKMCVTG